MVVSALLALAAADGDHAHAHAPAPVLAPAPVFAGPIFRAPAPVLAGPVVVPAPAPLPLPLPAPVVVPAPVPVVVARPEPVYRPAPVPSYAPAPEPVYDGPAVYNFGYAVKDDLAALNFGHTENRDGYKTQGSYYVNLPDGRLQTVNYHADEAGYVADVQYSGAAIVPAYEPARPAYVNN